MELEFTYTPDDLQEASNVLWRASSRYQRVLGSLIIVVVVFFAVWKGWKDSKLDSVLPAGNSSFDHILTYFPAIMALVFALTVLWYYFRGQRLKGRKLWNSSPIIQQPQTMILEVDGLKFASPLADSLIRWPVMHYWQETTNLFVIRLTSKALLIIPKRAATSDQIEQLRREFSERIVPPAKGFPVTTALDSNVEAKDLGRESPQ